MSGTDYLQLAFALSALLFFVIGECLGVWLVSEYTPHSRFYRRILVLFWVFFSISLLLTLVTIWLPVMMGGASLCVIG